MKDKEELMTAREYLELHRIDPDAIYDESGLTNAEKLDAECEKIV